MKHRVITFIAIFVTALFAGLVQAKTVTIEAQDTLRFSVEHIVVSPGEEVTVTLVNNTSLPAMAMSHNYVQLTADANPKAFDHAALTAKANDYIPKDKAAMIIAHTQLVSGGESDTVTFTAPEQPGDYPYICSFPGHFAAGMRGTLTVTAK